MKLRGLIGGQADIVHINGARTTLDFDGMVLFSFGDDLGSGQVMALKMRHALGRNSRLLWQRDLRSLVSAMVFKC